MAKKLSMSQIKDMHTGCSFEERWLARNKTRLPDYGWAREVDGMPFYITSELDGANNGKRTFSVMRLDREGRVRAVISGLTTREMAEEVLAKEIS